MYLNKRGFLLADACICVLITGVTALIVSSTLNQHVSITHSLQKADAQVEEQFENANERAEQCIGADTDSY